MKVKTGGPDGLEAWCVALAACFINFVMAGLGRMSGIMYVAFIDIFHVDRKQASVPFSARSLARNLLGPVVGIIGQKYGVRVSSVAGGIIGTLSTFFCFYANNLLWITIIWGVFGGIGAAMTTTLNQVILGQHFKKYRTTASGMSFSGGCVGSFFFPALLEYLLHTYGLNGTFLILAGVFMNVIPAAMLLRKPSWAKAASKRQCEALQSNHAPEDSIRESRDDQDQAAAVNISNNHVYDNIAYVETEHNVKKRSSNKVKDPDMACKFNINTAFLRQNNRIITLLLTTNFANRHKENKSHSCLPRSNLLKELEDLYNVIDIALYNLNYTEKDVKNAQFESGSFRKMNLVERKEILRKLKIHTKAETKEIILLLFKKLLNEDMKNIVALFPEDEHQCISKILEQIRYIYCLFLECESYYELPSDVTKQSTSEASNEKPVARSPAPLSNSFSTHIKTAFRLQTNPMFLLISLCRCVHFITFVPAVTTIVDFTMDKGLLEEEGKYVIAALSLGDLIGRLGLGWVTDRNYIGLPRYMLIVMIAQGACTASLSLVYSKIALFFDIALFGLLQGSLFVRHPVLVSKYLGSNEQSVAMGCFNFSSGLLGFVLPIYIGYFRDTVGSYNYIFYINGACGTCIGLLWLFEPFFVRFINRSKERDSNCNQEIEEVIS